MFAGKILICIILLHCFVKSAINTTNFNHIIIPEGCATCNAISDINQVNECHRIVASMRSNASNPQKCSIFSFFNMTLDGDNIFFKNQTLGVVTHIPSIANRSGWVTYSAYFELEEKTNPFQDINCYLRDRGTLFSNPNPQAELTNYKYDDVILPLESQIPISRSAETSNIQVELLNDTYIIRTDRSLQNNPIGLPFSSKFAIKFVCDKNVSLTPTIYRVRYYMQSSSHILNTSD